MFNKVTSLTAALLLTSTVANAYTLVETQKQAGTVTAVNAEKHQLTVLDKHEQKQTVTLSPTAEAVIGRSRAKAISSLEVGHSIAWEQTKLTQSFEEISGEIKAVSYHDRTLDIKLDNSKRVTIQLDPGASVSSVEKEDISLRDIRPGYTITIKNNRMLTAL